VAYSINAKDHFSTNIYSGTGSSNAITGVGFEPSLTWIKARSHNYSHCLIDAVRGVGTTISSDGTGAAYSSSTEITSFDSDGFTLGTDSGVNNGSHTFVSWNWKAGTTSGITQGGASITPTAYSFNQTAGFSIIKYTGTGSAATVPHGLNAVPKTIWIKKTSGSESWGNYHVSLGSTHFVQFNTTGASSDNAVFWNDTDPTSSVFTINTDAGVNGSGQTYIAYCFAEKTGFSKFGQYTGNGNTNGPFNYCGFKPSLVIFKKTNDVGDWQMTDDKRVGYNPDNYYLQCNSNGAEQTTNIIDLVSNGFKIRGDNSNGWNKSGSTYIYMAFAKAPLVGSNNVPCTAR